MDGGSDAAIARRLFGLANLQISLAGIGGLSGIHAGSQAAFFQEVAPAFMGVRRALTVLILAHDGLGVLPALDDFDYSS